MSSSRERFVAIVQARIGSSRLPGKVLLPLAGRPVVCHVVERLRRVRGLDHIVVATPAGSDNAPLIELLEREDVPTRVWDGDEADLLGRYLDAGRASGAGGVVMVDSDCPLFDIDTVSRMVEALRGNPDAEYVRISPPSIEGGVACLRLSTFERIHREGPSGPEREHATLRILEHPEQFRIVDIAPDPAFADLSRAHRFWLDTDADYRFLQEVFSRLAGGPEPVDLHAVVRLLDAEPALRDLNSHVKQRDPTRRALTVVLVPPDDAQGRAFFDALAKRLVEVHQVGVHTVAQSCSEVGAMEGFDAAVLQRGDPRIETLPFPVYETSSDEPVARAAADVESQLRS